MYQQNINQNNDKDIRMNQILQLCKYEMMMRELDVRSINPLMTNTFNPSIFPNFSQYPVEQLSKNIHHPLSNTDLPKMDTTSSFANFNVNFNKVLYNYYFKSLMNLV